MTGVENRVSNLRFLRLHMGCTQGEFISRYLQDEGKAISVATLSNLEKKGGARLSDVIYTVSQKLGLDPSVFSEDQESFMSMLQRDLNTSGEKVGVWQVPASKNSTNQILYKLTMYLADRIFLGELKRGDKIESDRVLAEKFGVGRSVIREALKVLDVLNMIDIRPGQGTYISSEETSFFVIPLSWTLFLNGGQIDSILEVRNTLEVRAAHLAAHCEDDEKLELLHSSNQRLHEAFLSKDMGTFLESDLDFHFAVAECSNNQIIIALIRTISSLMRRISKTGMVSDEQIRKIHEEHNRIYGAILMRDAQSSSKFMEEHLKNSMERYNYQ